MPREADSGFTLIELVIVVMIVGLLSALTIPRYRRSIETSKAEEAGQIVIRLGEAHRIFRVDTGGYLSAARLTNTCNGSACIQGSSDRCQIVACQYVPAQNWGMNSTDTDYYFMVGSGAQCGLSLSCASGVSIACGARQNAGAAAYNSWGYLFCSDGSLVYNSAAGGPPRPVGL